MKYIMKISCFAGTFLFMSIVVALLADTSMERKKE